MKKTPQHKGLSNPALIAAAASPEGQKTVGKIAEVAVVQAQTGAKILLFVFKTAVIVGGVYLVYRAYAKRFIKLGNDPTLDPANVSDGQAAARAQAMYVAMYGVGADVDAVAKALNGLNHNGWVKVYNAFGLQKPATFGDAMNLVEWIQDQFGNDEDDMRKLRFQLNGEF